MKSRILPAVIGLSIALLFSLNADTFFSHLLYLGAAYLLYLELIEMSVGAHQKRSDTFSLLLTGIFSLFLYAVSHALLLRTAPSSHTHYDLFGVTFSHYEIASVFIFGYTSLFFVILHYGINVFSQKKAVATQEDPPSNSLFARPFQNMLVGFHALFYSTFFLYSIVKVKYAYLYIPHPSLTAQTSFILLLLVWILVWIYDSTAYFGGTRWGERKLGLQVSPQKSWAGLLFGALSLLLLLTAFQTWGIPLFPKEIEQQLQQLWFFQTSGELLLLTVAIVFAAQLGDLIASFFKRAVQVKDSGSLFGSHGGFLDRNDSAIFTFALFYQLLLFTI